MTPDERAIRDLVGTWMRASEAGDLDTVLGLMAEDVLFMVPGRPPFGRQEFAAASRAMKDMRVHGEVEIVELELAGEWAWLRNHIDVTMTPRDGAPIRRSGYTLSVLRKRDGRWLLARDANFVA